MTDFDYEVKEKRSVARCAKYKINGSKSRKCTLATDYMTPSQIRKMNGKMVSYNLNRPMTLEEFKKIPPAAGREYILRLVELYGCNYTSLMEMFGCGRKACVNLLSGDPYNIRFSAGSKMSNKKKSMWHSFLSGGMPEEKPEKGNEPAGEQDGKLAEPPSQKEVEPEKKQDETSVLTADGPEQNHAAMKMDRFSLSFSGRLSVDAIANSLRLVLGEGAEGTLVINGFFGDRGCDW